jgi:hypothetical protein
VAAAVAVRATQSLVYIKALVAALVAILTR